MKSLLNQIKKLQKSKTKDLVDKRIKQFKLLNKKNNDAWFSELCFCLMTANWKAKEAIEIQNELCKGGFCNFSENKLKSYLKEKGHRFWPQRAERICLARTHIKIKDILKNEEKNNRDKREWLVNNIKGLGYKESSHFLRNIGYFDYAILDRHIINLMAEEKIIERPKTLTKRKYLEIEEKFKSIANKINMSMGELDLYMWYIKTNNILK